MKILIKKFQIKMFLFIYVLVIFYPLLMQKVCAEPWLSVRYAQNCAACHAPGRINKPAIGRRCTLSCQGCHVNPQGGGLRNQYGKWNQERWLRSFRTQFFKDKPTPAPLQRQPYYERVKQLASQAKEFYGNWHPTEDIKKEGETNNSEFRNGPRASKKEKGFNRQTAASSSGLGVTKSALSKEAPSIKWIKEVAVPNRYFDKDSYSEWRAVVASESDFVSTLPKDDPYRLERSESITAGGDFRYFVMKADDSELLGGKSTRTWFMGADLGARLRPTRYHQFSTVVEARFLNAPSNQDPEDGFTSGAFAKSAYLLMDDLAYNSFIQVGLYRPMFGLYDVDHDTIANRVSGLTQRAVFKGVAVGTAPNVPFLVLNYLQPTKLVGTENEASKGLVATTGLRFVTLGASAALSYWDTEYNSSSTVSRKRKMYSLTGGLTYKDFLVNLELLRAQISISDGSLNAGTVVTLQSKYRIWRENYIVANTAYSNVATDLTQGKGSEYSVGVKSFLMSNLEVEGLFVVRKRDESPIVKTDYNLIQLQAHTFF
ncbi:MAG: hypothetical protein K1X29_01180 [Bdellovibrionales bacterium]|nr:hypothetical protein [Bdellovibrionales bacterium]